MSHPLDSYVFWETTEKEADEFRQLYDKIIKSSVSEKELNKLLSFVCNETSSAAAFNNAGADQ